MKRSTSTPTHSCATSIVSKRQLPLDFILRRQHPAMGPNLPMVTSTVRRLTVHSRKFPGRRLANTLREMGGRIILGMPPARRSGVRFTGLVFDLNCYIFFFFFFSGNLVSGLECKSLLLSWSVCKWMIDFVMVFVLFDTS